MSDITLSSRPLLQPVLTLQKQAVPHLAVVQGKKEEDIKHRRLDLQRRALTSDLRMLRSEAAAGRLNVFGGYIILVAEMFDDSLATSWTPRSLFQIRGEVLTRAAASNGYFVEIDEDDLPFIERRIATNDSINCRCDISRVRKIRPWSVEDIYRDRTHSSLWRSASEFERGRGFIVWLAPFRQAAARAELLQRLDELRTEDLFLPTAPRLLLQTRGRTEIVVPDLSERQGSLAIVKRDYRAYGHGRALVEVLSSVALNQLISSGAVFRIDPVQHLQAASPGSGREPETLPQEVSHSPIVGHVDGGCNATRYRIAEAWREPPLVADGNADTKHGNQVASVIIHGHEWNNNLPLPELFCRIGVAQSLARDGARVRHDAARLISYIENTIAHHPETRVWNLSWNERAAADPVLVSALGHEIALIARRHKVLFVISAGNVSGTQGDRIAPPADCEAALVVGGRQFNGTRFGEICPQSLPGFGPELQLVPHVTTYSPLRVLGGVVTRGTSFQTGLISAVAAHTFENLKDPTPDLVKALIINCTDLVRFDRGLGWGTPCLQAMPWNCAPGTVTLAFRAQLKTGMLYYWNDIPIPPEMVRNGKLRGSASLTTIHQPFCNEEGGPNYFATRVGAAIQYRNLRGDFDNLLGSKEVEDTPEQTARAEEFKWQPTRRACKQMRGVAFSGAALRLYARLYARNVEQFGYRTNAELPAVETVFVLSFSDGSRSPQIYNSMAVSLGQFVESAVIDQDIPVRV
jgi:hypothetical protein